MIIYGDDSRSEPFETADPNTSKRASGTGGWYGWGLRNESYPFPTNLHNFDVY